MANILFRSPYFVTITTAGHLSAQLALTIDGTLRYTILKNAISNRTVFEIATLVRDYFEENFVGTTIIADTLAISYVVTTFTAVDGGGVASAQGAVTHTGFNGYGKFGQGVNYELPTSQDPTYVGDCELTRVPVGDGIIYLPDNTAGKLIGWTDDTTPVLAVFNIGTTDTSVDTPMRTYNVERVCNPKYTSIKSVYLNRYGMWQEFYFFLKSVESFTTKEEKFKRNLFREATSNYSIYRHQTKVFDKNARTKLILNTHYIDECYNEVIQDIMLSEFVYIYFDSAWRTVNISTSSLTFKTSVNDRLIQYTIEVEYANEVINTIV